MVPRRRVVAYASVALLFWASLFLYVPTLPNYVGERTGGLAPVGAVLAMYGLWQALLRLPVGIAADAAGRRKPFEMGGILLAAAGAILLQQAVTFTGLLAGRSLTGIAAAAWVPMVVSFSALFTPEQAILASSLVTVSSSLGRLLGTALNAPLNQLAGPSAAFTSAAAAAFLAALLLLPQREAPRPRMPVSMAGIARIAARKDVLLPSVLAALIQYAVWASTFGFVPILARSMGAGDVTLSLLATVNLAVYTVGNLSASVLARRWAAPRFALVSFSLLVLGLAMCALAPGTDWLIAAQVAIGLGSGILYPVLMGASIRYVDGAERSTAMGLHQSVYAVGMFAGPWISGLLASRIGVQPMLGATAAFVLVGGLAGSRAMAAAR